MVHFLLLYGAKLILSAIFIVGFYLITRGEWIVKPDGSKEWVGKIFSGWSKFLQQHTISKDYCKNDEWYRQAAVLLKHFKPENVKEILDNGLIVQNMDGMALEYLKVFCAEKRMLFSIRDYMGFTLISVYKETEVYKIPFWITAPLGQCITCMSSFYGSLCFWFWYSLGDKFMQGMPTVSIIGLWFFFCISLTTLNECVFLINYKLKK